MKSDSHSRAFCGCDGLINAFADLFVYVAAFCDISKWGWFELIC